MKREVKTVRDGMLQITLEDDRWYARTLDTGETVYLPSVTWISKYTPVTEGLLRWYAREGWDGAMEQLGSAGDRGTKIHAAVSLLIDGEEVRHDTRFMVDGETEPQELTREEWEAVLSFVDWWQYADVKHVYFREKTIWTDRYAGTLDLLCYCENPQKPPRAREAAAAPGINLIDFKTSKDIYPSHMAQISAYAAALPDPNNAQMNGITNGQWCMTPVRLAILQLGYNRNSRGWKYTPVENRMDLFEAAYTFWRDENEGARPPSYSLPLSVKLNVNEEVLQ